MSAFGVLAAVTGALAALAAIKGTGTLHELLYPKLYRRTAFPEGHFPAARGEDFRTRSDLGYQRMRDASIVICGISKDDSETLPRTIRRIESTGALFQRYHVVVFENDSVDATPDLLHEWADSNPRVTILSGSLQERADFPKDRFHRLAECRNRYLDHLDRVPELDQSDYVMVVDMDLTGGWSLDGIASSFAEEDWDAMASNSIGYHSLRRTYYDTAALRPKTVLRHGWFNRLVGEAWQLRRGDRPIPVDSAFGGLCIYARAVLRSRRYAGTHAAAPACEHIALHDGGEMRCFLNPSQITVIGTQSEKGYGKPRPRMDWLRRLLLNW